jgi:hypothetical protein
MQTSPSSATEQTAAQRTAAQQTGGQQTGGQQSGSEQAAAESSAGRHRRTDPETLAAEAPTLPDLPAVPGKHAMPGQRSGDADQAERSRSGTAAPQDDDPGRR